MKEEAGYAGDGAECGFEFGSVLADASRRQSSGFVMLGQLRDKGIRIKLAWVVDVSFSSISIDS
jgi:hypothetical protein